jgi:hypothetical protein
MSYTTILVGKDGVEPSSRSYQLRNLTVDIHARIFALHDGLEPPTLRLTGERSNH